MPRDTDRDWHVIAQHQPYFGVLANDRFLADNLTPEAIDEFYETGRADVAHVVGVLARLASGPFEPRVALDFGCGVGRLSFAMAEHAKRVIGLDVADGMLDVGRAQAQARGVSGVELTSEFPTETIDWVNSLIVFQHIPPERGDALLAELVELLAPGGFLSVQLSFFRDNRHVGELVRDIADYRYDGQRVEMLAGPAAPEAGVMSMYDYDLNRVFRTLFVGGIESVTVQHTDHGGCHGAWLFGVKGA